MDMLVTTPKSEIDNSKREGDEVEASGGYWFRTFKFRPKVNTDDKIFFVENGLIRGYGVVFDVVQLTQAAICDVTGRDWGEKGGWMMKYRAWKWLSPCIQFKGFQGIRYIKNLPELKKRLKELCDIEVN
jgi:hypothetical protein